jgi:HAD superfamily hydrolase (TIGR01458 family)
VKGPARKMKSSHERPRVKAILLDIEGVVCVGGTVLPGSLDAISRIRELRIPLRFITNTTRRPRRQIACDLARLGVVVKTDDIFTPAVSAREYLCRHCLSPFLLVHPNLHEDFAGLGAGSGEAVVVGDAGSSFTYDLLNTAFRKIIHGAGFLALAKNRNFLDSDFELSLDAGPFVAALEYASGREATVLGKPAPTLFELAAGSTETAAAHVAMIGDDVEADVQGALAAGLKAVLVRTGKYQAGQEAQLAGSLAYVADDLYTAVELLFG